MLRPASCRASTMVMHTWKSWDLSAFWVVFSWSLCFKGLNEKEQFYSNGWTQRDFIVNRYAAYWLYFILLFFSDRVIVYFFGLAGYSALSDRTDSLSDDRSLVSVVCPLWRAIAVICALSSLSINASLSCEFRCCLPILIKLFTPFLNIVPRLWIQSTISLLRIDRTRFFNFKKKHVGQYKFCACAVCVRQRKERWKNVKCLEQRENIIKCYFIIE